MEDTDLAAQNRADAAGSNERPNATGEPYDPYPNAENVMQDEDVYGAAVPVNVCVKGPVRTQELPTRLGALRSVLVPALDVGGQPIRLLSADPRRRRAVVLLGANQTLQLGATQKEAAGQYAFQIASGTATPFTLELFSTDELWAVRSTVATVISVLEERWTG